MPRIRTGLAAIRQVRNWPIFILDFFKMKRPGFLTYRMRDGARYRVRAGTWDVRVISKICLRHDYNPPGFEVGEGDTVVDIGAQIGVFTVMAARRARRGRVFAFEPHPDNHARLVDNVRLNDLANVVTEQKAVARETGRREMFFSPTETA